MTFMLCYNNTWRAFSLRKVVVSEKFRYFSKLLLFARHKNVIQTETQAQHETLISGLELETELEE